MELSQITELINSTITTNGTNQITGQAVNNVLNTIVNKMSDYEYNNLWYGVERDMSSSDSFYTRIGNMDLHRSLPIHNKIKGCLLNNDGVVIKYLNDESWEDEILDGSQGQVMVEIPGAYWKFEIEETVYRIKISEFPLEGFTYHPTKYVGAYEAALNRTENKLASVVNTTEEYRGGNNQSEWDGTYRSLLGRPATSITRTNFRTYARNRGDYHWNIYTYDVHLDIYWLYTIEYANTNCQLDFNAELTSEGFHQGGLGAGVTGWDWGSWSSWNSNNPFVPCGVTNSLGNGTGVVNYTIKGTDGVSDIYTFAVPRYRGMELLYGHVWSWGDGYNILIEADGVGDSSSKAYICLDPQLFADRTSDNYTYVGNESRTGGYLKEINFDINGNFVPKIVGGGSTTYFSDYYYTNIPASDSSWRALLVGGSAYIGAGAGLGCFGSDDSASYSYASFGCRLVYKK